MTGVYYPYMASIVGKRRGKQTYYYLATSARVGGKPRIVEQKYLGTAAELDARRSDGANRDAIEADTASGVRRPRRRMVGDRPAGRGRDRRRGAGPGDADAGATVGAYLALACGEPGRGPALEARLRRLVEAHAGGRLVKLDRPDGSSPVLGRGGPRRRRSSRDRGPDHTRGCPRYGLD